MSKFISEQKYVDLRLRGLKLADVDTSSQTNFVEVEFLCATEHALESFGRFLTHLQMKGHKVVFTKLHLCGDKHLKPCEDIPVGAVGCAAIGGLFQTGMLQNLIEFRFTDFIVDPFAMLGLS